MIKRLKYIWIYLLALIWVVPLIWLVFRAFIPESMKGLSNSGIAFKNFSDVLKSAPFGRYYINTVIVVAVIFLVQVITTTLAAYAFAKLRFRGKNIIFALVLIQLMVPNEALMFTNYNTLTNMGLIDTKIGIMLPFFSSALGIFLLRQTFKAIPDDFEEAASIDGCNFFEKLIHIYMPLAKPTYVAFGLVSVSYHWNDFLWPLIVTNSVNNRTVTVGLAIFAKSNETGVQWSETCAATFMVIFPLVLAFLLFQKQFISSFIHSGIK